MPTTHPLIAAIADDDPAVQKALLGISKPLIPVKEVFAWGARKRAKGYEDINSGLLPTHTIDGRRYAYAIDFAKYLVALERQDKAAGRKHSLAVNRPRHDRQRNAVAA